MSNKGTFNCPSCGASLDAGDGKEKTIRCIYCDTSVVVPKALRDSTVRVDLQQLGDLQGQVSDAGRQACITIVIVFSIIIIAVAGVIYALWTAEDTSSSSSSNASFASLAFSFGEEGIGQGMFQDARHVAVDGAGLIYVGEYGDNARIQVFEPDGTFKTLWVLGNETPLRSMAVTTDGTLVMVYTSQLFRYNGLTGELLGQIQYENVFDKVFCNAIRVR